jgi:hypothetical protein
MATDARTNRDLMTREKTARYVYKPSSTLPDPTPIPGVKFRWIATHILGQADPTNVSRKMRDGWEPVKASDHPELMLEGNAKGNVEIGGLMLCKNSEEQVRAMSEYYANQNQAQMDSVDNNFMRDNDPRMQKFADRKSTSTRGTSFGAGVK